MQRPERLLPREDQRQQSVHQLPPKFPSRCQSCPSLRQFQSWTRSQPCPLLQLLHPSSQLLLCPLCRSSHHRQGECSLQRVHAQTWSQRGLSTQSRPEPKYLHQQYRSHRERRFRAGNQNPSEQLQLPAERQHWQLELRYPSFQPGQCHEGSERLVRDR